MLSRIIPFIGLGVLLVVFAFTLIFLSYIFIVGSVIGLVIYIIAAIRLQWLRWELSKT
jgi:hypothetical protein